MPRVIARPASSSQRESLAARRRLEIYWAIASFLALIVSWDAALRLDERVPLPRMRVAQVMEEMEPQRAEWVAP
ncbi:hypothetical protein HNQ60_001446 [Povalibacter uvarum]|uniref:Uncharacterized protein n=1 Tax=Povalibacter uvarum TaxID=732238 RepID=A0A841HK01_9GAMM|nr:hypothetical protein [Povalibacter uvarum]MBB6092568.1 hypothetical protein [Povalibacter uvarum]